MAAVYAMKFFLQIKYKTYSSVVTYSTNQTTSNSKNEKLISFYSDTKAAESTIIKTA